MKRATKRTLIGLLLSITLLIYADGIAAQDDKEHDIPRVDFEPELSDFYGMKPNEQVIGKMLKIEGFVQRLPHSGESPSQNTEVYLAYDEGHFYALFLAFDDKPHLIRANMSPREKIDGDDVVSLIIDTFNDQRTAYSFRSTPLGIQWDGRWNEATSSPSFDQSFEAVWESEGEITENGYLVKMKIPLDSLRFRNESEQKWRLQLSRNIPRLSEMVFWPEYSLEVDGRLNQAALIKGIRGVNSGSIFQFAPFSFFRSSKSLTADTSGLRFDRSEDFDAGLDSKFVLGESFVLDFTINPDFSQIESDEPQVTVNERFEVLFPERRPFFVENADYFATDSTLLFTRRIVDPEGGLRLTGKYGDWGIATLLANDRAIGRNRADDDPLVDQSANVGILRIFKELPNQSRVGAFFSQRDILNGYNRIGSIDSRVRLTQNWTAQGQLVESQTLSWKDNSKSSGGQRNVRLDRSGKHLDVHVHYIDTDKNFVSQLGFQNRFYRSNTQGLHGEVIGSVFSESIFNNIDAKFSGAYLENKDGTKIFSEVEQNARINWDAETYLTIGYKQSTESLFPDEFDSLESSRAYKYDKFYVSAGTEFLSEFGVIGIYENGEAINLFPSSSYQPEVEDLERFTAEFLWRPLERLQVNGKYILTAVKDKQEGRKVFSNEIGRLNMNYQFSKELSIRLITQYNETDSNFNSTLEDKKNINFDLLLRYVINPWTAMYVGYNSNSSNSDLETIRGIGHLISTNDLHQDSSQIFAKISYLF